MMHNKNKTNYKYIIIKHINVNMENIEDNRDAVNNKTFFIQRCICCINKQYEDDKTYGAIWDNKYSSDMNYILNNYKSQVQYLINKNEKLLNINNKLRKKRKRYNNNNNKNWFTEYNYDNISCYINNLCDKLNINYNIIDDFIKNISIIEYDDMKNEIKEKYKYYKKYNSGRYSTTFIIKNISNNKNVIIKKTHIKNKCQLLNSCKELLLQYYVYKLTELSPNVYFYYLYIHNNKLYSYFGMDRIRYVFYQLFDIDKMYKCYKMKNKIVLNEFIKALQIYVGSLEKLILNGILHNDSHDGNFCFKSNGNICFIDFGEVKLIKKINNIIDNETNIINYDLLTPEMNYLYCKYLDDELDYFLDMYYFYEDYTEDEEDKYRKFYLSKYSPIRAIHKALESNQYKFGHHIKYVNEKIDIQLILNNINCKLEFKD